jgi:hypothetical protein
MRWRGRRSTPNEVQPGQVVDRVRSTAPATRLRPRPGIQPHLAGCGGGRARRHRGDADGQRRRPVAQPVFRTAARPAPVGAGEPRPRAGHARADAGRRGPGHRLHLHRGLAAGPRGRPDRGQRAPWRPDVVHRQRDRRPADGVVERRRGVGRDGGRLHPSSQAASRRGSAVPSGCGAPTCASWSAAGRPAALPAHSGRRWPAPSTASSW